MSHGGTETPDSNAQPASTPSQAAPPAASLPSQASAPSTAKSPDSPSVASVARRQSGEMKSAAAVKATSVAIKTAQGGPTSAQQIGHYRVLERIGAGGMGAVYRAVDLNLNREVALKVMPPDMNRNSTMVARFKREAMAAAALDHPNIVRIYEVSEEKGRHYLAMELIKGKDLADVIAQWISDQQKYQSSQGQLGSPFPMKKAVDYLRQATRALEHAYEKGIVHRDIKPSNLLITDRGEVKLCDMGLALRQDAGNESKVTRDGTTVGTVDYMAPEQARDSRLVDTRSDIYSLGCTLYQMLTGRVPYEEGSIAEKLLKHATELPPNPQQFNSNIPESVIYVLNRMLEKKAEDRYQTPTDLLKDLDSLGLARDVERPATSIIDTLAIGNEDDTTTSQPTITRRSQAAEKKARLEAKKAQQRKLWIVLSSASISLLTVTVLIIWLTVGRQPSTPTHVPPRNVGQGSSQATVASTAVQPVSSPTTDVAGNSVIQPSMASKNPGSEGVGEPRGSGTADISNSNAKPEVGKVPSGDTIAGNPNSSPEASNGKSETVVTSSVAQPRLTDAERRKLQEEMYPPWPTKQIPGTPVRVARGTQSEAGGIFGALESACQAAKTGGSKIHMEDNGPLFERSFTLQKADFDIRPLPDRFPYRPVVAFDMGADRRNVKQNFIQAKNCNFVIEGVDFVVNADDLAATLGVKPFWFFDVQGGDLSFKNCTFTVFGKHKDSVSFIRLSGLRDADSSRAPDRSARISIENCLFRGESLTVATLATAAADVKVINSLFVSGQPGALFDFQLPTEPAPRSGRTLRLIQSTCVTRGDLIAIDGTAETSLELKLLDSIIACMGGSRKMIRAKGWADVSGNFPNATLDERSTLYTGWDVLFQQSGSNSMVVKISDEWWKAWKAKPSDCQVRDSLWPTQALGDLCAVVTTTFADLQIDTDLRSRLADGPIGVAMETLPTPVQDLEQRTYGEPELRDHVATSAVLPSSTMNPQKNKRFGAWQGEQSRREQLRQQGVTDVSRDPVLELTFDASPADADLGKFIASQSLLESNTVIVRGSGVRPFSPISLKGKSLVVWVQGNSNQPPLRFAPVGTDERMSLIDVIDGDLIMEGVSILPAGPGKLARFVRVQNGNLALGNCRLFGLVQGDANFEAISFQGGQQRAKPFQLNIDPAPNGKNDDLHMDFHPAAHPRVNTCLLSDCYLGAEARCLNLRLSEGLLRIENCVAVTPGTFSRIELDEVSPQEFEAYVTLNHNTITASRSFFDVGGWVLPTVPVRSFQFTSSNNLFCDPFEVGTNRPRNSVLLRYESRTLQQGIMRWQSSRDGISKDVHSYLLPTEFATKTRQKEQDWVAVWGRPHIKDLLVDSSGDRIRLDGKNPKLKDFDATKSLAVLAVHAQCEAARKASEGGPIGADIPRLVP